MERILVIDDDDEIRWMVKEMLVRAGYEVMEARNGREGVSAFREAPTKLVITDIFMPEQEGLETIRELKTLDSGVKILAMSGGIRAMDGSATLRLAKSLGADQAIPKPIVKQDLLAAVVDLLDME
jgi:CheY-like chemotaxis protein